MIACNRFFAAALGLVLMPTVGSSALVYELTFGQSAYHVGVGGTQDVDIFFRELRTGDDTARLAIGGGDGLIELSFKLNYSMTPSGSGAGPTFQSFDLNTGTDRFSAAPSSFQNNPLTEQLTVNAIVPEDPLDTSTIEVAPFSENETDIYSIFVGRVSFLANGPQGTETTLSLAEGDALFGQFFEPAGISGSTASFTAVPEPGSIVVLAGVFAAGYLRHRRRRSN